MHVMATWHKLVLGFEQTAGFLPLCHQRANKLVKEKQQLGGIKKDGYQIEIKGLCTAGRGFVPCLYLYNVNGSTRVCLAV